jgi:hypothetical protein
MLLYAWLDLMAMVCLMQVKELRLLRSFLHFHSPCSKLAKYIKLHFQTVLTLSAYKDTDQALA